MVQRGDAGVPSPTSEQGPELSTQCVEAVSVTVCSIPNEGAGMPTGGVQVAGPGAESELPWAQDPKTARPTSERARLVIRGRSNRLASQSWEQGIDPNRLHPMLA